MALQFAVGIGPRSPPLLRPQSDEVARHEPLGRFDTDGLQEIVRGQLSEIVNSQPHHQRLPRNPRRGRLRDSALQGFIEKYRDIL